MSSGCGKSSTMAAPINEINQTQARHIITIEHPIEYSLKPQLSFLRQREVGRDTPTFEQALLKHFMGSADAHSQGANRWRWLSDTLRDTLTTAALKQPGLNARQRETLDQVITPVIYAEALELIEDHKRAGRKTVIISSEEIRRALDEPVSQIIDAMKSTLDKTPPELAADIMDRGIVLAGEERLADLDVVGTDRRDSELLREALDDRPDSRPPPAEAAATRLVDVAPRHGR